MNGDAGHQRQTKKHRQSNLTDFIPPLDHVRQFFDGQHVRLYILRVSSSPVGDGDDGDEKGYVVTAHFEPAPASRYVSDIDRSAPIAPLLLHRFLYSPNFNPLITPILFHSHRSPGTSASARATDSASRPFDR